MDRVYNFSAGPSMMPEAVLKKAQKKARLPWGGRALLLCYASSGRGVKVNSWKVPWEAPSANMP